MRMQKGFTLLEVMVATMIMAIAVTALLGSLARSNENAARLQERDRIVSLARTQMQELLLLPRLPHGQMLEGRWERTHTGAGIEAGWTARVEPMMLRDPLGGAPPPAGVVVPKEMVPAMMPGRVLDRVVLEAWWKSGAARKTLTLETYKRGSLMPEEKP